MRDMYSNLYLTNEEHKINKNSCRKLKIKIANEGKS
jgi:hypothetical protein